MRASLLRPRIAMRGEASVICRSRSCRSASYLFRATVHLTSRGVDALRDVPRSILTRRVFHHESGKPLSWPYFAQDWWHRALELAGLEARPPYSLRHSFALHSLQAGVPIANLARQIRHADVSRTFTVYGGWVREMGADAARLRETWIGGTNTAPSAEESRSK